MTNFCHENRSKSGGGVAAAHFHLFHTAQSESAKHKSPQHKYGKEGCDYPTHEQEEKERMGPLSQSSKQNHLQQALPAMPKGTQAELSCTRDRMPQISKKGKKKWKN